MVKPWSKPPSITRFRRSGYDSDQRLPTAFELKYGCVRGCEIDTRGLHPLGGHNIPFELVTLSGQVSILFIARVDHLAVGRLAVRHRTIGDLAVCHFVVGGLSETLRLERS